MPRILMNKFFIQMVYVICSEWKGHLCQGKVSPFVGVASAAVMWRREHKTVLSGEKMGRKYCHWEAKQVILHISDSIVE